jgi:hypothetical protein
MSEEKKEKIGYAFRIGAQTADGINIDVTGNFPIGAPNEVINVELDKLVDIFSRQRAKTLLAGEEDTLRKEKASLESMRKSLAKAFEKEKTNASERANIDALKRSIVEFEARIANREQGVVSLKALI